MRWTHAVALGVGLTVGLGIGLVVRSNPALDQNAAIAAIRRTQLPRYDVSSRPDAELAALFKSNRQLLDTLLEMAKADTKRLVDDGVIAWISVEFLPWPKGVASCTGIDDVRANEYRDLMRKIGIRCSLRAGLNSAEGDTIYIQLVDSRVAWPNVVWENGLWYSQVPPGNAMFDVTSEREKIRRAYLPLDGGWYIFVSGRA